MTREGAEALLDGLLIADVHSDLSENREANLLSRDGNARLRHQGPKSDRLEDHGFTAAVRPADDHHSCGCAQLKTQRHGFFPL